ncbi:DUF6182 family protein [Streptomyces sp. NPDC091272]|uniref:DUF6182 family protein n=1 Tax=Streptomyces sp. NPDC091272 TaxID=3365981 RepID=UPI0037F6FDEB
MTPAPAGPPALAPTGPVTPTPAGPVTLTQSGLRDRAAHRVRAARPDLAARHDLATLEGLLAAQHDIAGEDGSRAASATVVLKDLDLARWVRDTCAYTLALPPYEAAAWRTAFTRTVFLAGNPAHLRERFSFAHVADDLSAAWTAPAEAPRTTALRRLLKLFQAPTALPYRPDTPIEVPGAPPGTGRSRSLYLATAGCTVAEALVHLNHVLTEAVLDGLVAPGDRLVLRQVPRIVGLPAPLAAVRVVSEPQLPGRLKAAAGLTEEVPDA